MEMEAEARNVNKESATQISRYQKRCGIVATEGENYEVAVCSLLYLRALRHASHFLLASNHDLAGRFDDCVLFYRLKEDQGHKYRAILIQAKHKSKVTVSIFPFRLKEYLQSFKKIRNLWSQSLKMGNYEIHLHEIMLVLYTNTGCMFGNKVVDVTDNVEMQHLKDLLSSGGRLLRIPEAQQVELPQGEETSDFLAHLLLCTEQMSVKTADNILEEELRNLLKLSSQKDTRNINTELKRVMKTWWGEKGSVHYLSPESEEWCKILEMQIRHLNEDTLNIDSKLNLEFTGASLEQFGVVDRCVKMNWICVKDEYQAKVARSRLFRAQRNSIVIGVRSLEHSLEEIETLWGNNTFQTLVMDMSDGSPDECSLMLQRLQEAVDSDASRYLVVIYKGNPPSGGWNVVNAEPTWSVLHPITRDRILSAPVRLQGKTVALTDVVGANVSDVMTDEFLNSISECKTEIKLGVAMPEALEYYVPRCLQRISSKTINVHTIINTKTLLFSQTYISSNNEFRKRFKTLYPFQVHTIKAIKNPTIIIGIKNDCDIRELCCRFLVQGIYGEISMKGLQGKVKEFIPFTWTCEEKVIVIEGPPGVGKSSFVTMMCSRAKEQFPETWVLRFDMGRNTEYIKDTDFTEFCDIKEFLVKSLHKYPNNLERKLLEHSLTVTGNVLLFLDAFDEISPDFTMKCCELLKGIARTIRYRQMVVTTRPDTTRDVEEALQAKAFTLPVFSKKEQNLFLKHFSEAKGKIVSEQEISSLHQSAGTILEIPLLCRMAAENLLFRQEQLLLRCLNPWKRVFMYKIFVEQIVLNQLTEKFRLDVTMPGIMKLLEYSSKLHLQNLQGLAVRKLIPTDQLPPLFVSTGTPEQKLGLVVNTGGRVDFEHHTFAEYFLGCWLASNWQQCPRQLLRDVLFQECFEFVAATFNWLLFDGLPLHMAVTQGDEEVVGAVLTAGTWDRGGRTALHIAAMTEGGHRKIWELLVASGEDLNRKDDVLGTTAIKYAEITENWEFLDLGLEKGANIGELKFVTDQEASNEVIIYAVKRDLVYLSQFIWQRHLSIFQNESPLHMAAANNSKDIIKLLIQINSGIDVINKNGFTPLHEASRHGHLEAVMLLVESGADLNIITEDGQTALIWAAREGHLEVVKILLENGSDLNIRTENGFTALTYAAYGGHLEVVKVLLEIGADLNIKTEDGDTALAWAAHKGHLEMVNILIENGADLHIKTEDGDSALTWAAREGHLEMLKILLKIGADVNIKTEGGDTALTLAALKGHMDVVKILLENGADVNMKSESGDTALTLAVRQGHLELVTILLENGADLNINNKYGDTALTWAVISGTMDVVKKLLDSGADLNIETENGFMALIWAAREGNLDLVELLLDNGADINIKTEDCCTALTWASRQGHLEVVKVLVESGSDLNIKTEGGMTAMTWAAYEGYLEVVKILSENGADVNVKSKNGDSALTLAAREGHLEVVKLLLENGGDFHIKTEEGDTALTWAALGGHLEVIKILLQNGAILNVKTENGFTALVVAALRGYLEVLKY